MFTNQSGGKLHKTTSQLKTCHHRNFSAILFRVTRPTIRLVERKKRHRTNIRIQIGAKVISNNLLHVRHEKNAIIGRKSEHQTGNEAIKYYTIIYVDSFLFMSCTFFSPCFYTIYADKCSQYLLLDYFCNHLGREKKPAIMIYLLFFACDSIFPVINLREHIFNVACYDIVFFDPCTEKRSVYLANWRSIAKAINTTYN